VVIVADRGPGLKADELERVFDKFYHDDLLRARDCGLAICARSSTRMAGAFGRRTERERRDFSIHASIGASPVLRSPSPSGRGKG